MSKVQGLLVMVLPLSSYLPVLSDILVDIVEGEKFYWSILKVEGMGNFGSPDIGTLEELASEMSNGYLLSWKELNDISKQSGQIFDSIIVGSRSVTNLQKYKTYREMFEACEYAFVVGDLTYWYIFTKDHNLHSTFAKKFIGAKIISSDEENFCY